MWQNTTALLFLIPTFFVLYENYDNRTSLKKVKDDLKDIKIVPHEEYIPDEQVPNDYDTELIKPSVNLSKVVERVKTIMPDLLKEVNDNLEFGFISFYIGESNAEEDPQLKERLARLLQDVLHQNGYLKSIVTWRIKPIHKIRDHQVGHFMVNLTGKSETC